jgi:hypothetical protein
MKTALKELQPEVDKAVADMRQIIAKAVPELNVRLANRPKVSVPPIR